jgi:hypothetical protein
MASLVEGHFLGVLKNKGTVIQLEKIRYAFYVKKLKNFGADIRRGHYILQLGLGVSWLMLTPIRVITT